MDEKCPKGVHDYPEWRDTRKNHGGVYFFCRGCRREQDAEWHRRNYGGPYEKDENSVLLMVRGEPPEYIHSSERMDAAEHFMHRPDISLSQAAVRLRCTPRHVSRMYRKIRTGSWT